MILPFIETEKSDGWYIRIFSEHTKQEKLLWHFDEEDRIVNKVSGDGWLFQMDNELPKDFKKVFIPKGTYHRIVKTDDAKTQLVLEIKKLKESN